MKKLLFTLVALTGAVSILGCETRRDEELDRPGEAIEEGVDDVRRSAEDATD